MRFRVFSCALLFVSATSVFAALTPTGRNVPNEVLIKLREDASANALAGIEKQVDGQAKQIAKLRSGKLLRLRSRSRNVEALTQALSHNPHIEYVEPNAIIRLSATPNDPQYTPLWGLQNTGQSILGYAGIAGADIDAEAAWNVTTGSNTIVVGVVDTGIDYTHPDLAANIWSNPGGAGNPDCAAGTQGFNAINETCNPADDHGHGTHVAGTIGAVGNNGVGVAGVNWNVSIMGLKFLSSWGSGTTADAIEAIDFAVQAKIDGVNVRVLSNSWGGGSFSKALLDVINKANEHDILFVASAGNSGISTDSFPQYPAGYGTANMISVAATDNRDALAYFSNYGAATVHLAAPGVNVYSTLPGGSYGYNSGTSMAAPHVSGVAALVIAANPGFTTAQVKSAILNSAEPVPALAGRLVTGGRLNAAGAVGGTPSPDFRLAVSPAVRTVAQGSAASYVVTITRNNGFTGAVALSISGLPTGTTASFNPSSVTGTAATLLLTTSGTTPLNLSQFTIIGTSGAMTRSTTAALYVQAILTAGACPSFSTGLNISSSSAPTAVAIGDFNRNGRADTAISDANLNIVTVRADGASSGTSYSVGRAPLGVATGDFNRDGRPDLVTANSGSHDVSILLASATGFAPAVHYGAGTSPFYVATGDFNRDGQPDLAVANNGASSVSVLLGNGDGTFDAAADYATGSGPYWVATADFDIDGTEDLAVANFNSGTVSVLLGNGDGTFEPATNTSVGTKPSGVVAADFDGNGKVDLATSNYGSNNVSLLLGNGDGTFAAAVHFAAGTRPNSIDAGDFDGNGKPDLVVANLGSQTVSVLMANGPGSFAGALNIPVTYDAAHARTGDLDGDGKPDLVVLTQDYPRITYLFNISTCALNCGNFAAAATSSVGSSPDSAAAGDFNGDGKNDLAIVDSAANNIALRLGNGDGTFTAGTSVAAGTSPHGIVAGDFNGDGKLDLASASTNTNEAVVLLGNGDGTFQNAVAYATDTAPRSVAIGDFDRDGTSDLVLPARDANTVSVLLGVGDGTFQAAVDYSVGTGPRAVAVGDFNRDGLQDLAVANAGTANVSILLGNADGTFQAAVNVTVGTAPRSLVAGDLNRDGRLDLAVANGGSHDVSILLGNGDGTFQAPTAFAVGTQPLGIVAADLNADGKLDLATANINSHDVSVLISLDAGVFAPASNLPVGLSPTSLVAADFDRDGKSDLATMNVIGASFSTLLNRCPLPDVTIAKTHSGSFVQGGTGSYTITVSNAGTLSTTAGVAVEDTLPPGLAATAISGSGWNCVLSNTTCTRADTLAAGGSYPPITLTVRVHSGAPLNVTNTVAVEGGGEVNPLNNTATDPTSIVPMTDLLVTKTHTGAFAQGATGRTYKIVVRNAGGLATSGTVTLTDTLPTGLTATAMSGTGWSCNVGSLTCTRSDALAGFTSYPTITLTVNVAADAPSLVVNTATVTGGGDASPINNTASDPTTIWSSNTCGSFALPNHYSADTSGASLEVGDFNGDGNSDLVTSAAYPGNYSVLLGAGNGTFATAVEYTARYAHYLTSGDLDHDGDLDLVSVSEESDSVAQVHLGAGDGTFAPAVTYEAGSASYMRGAELVDLDRDGNLDFLTRETWYDERGIIFLGNGDGTLQTPAFFDVPTDVQGWTVADVDGDTAVDLLLVSGATLHYMRGNGDGTFQAAVPMNLPDGSLYGVAAGDFNGDGKLDAAVTHWSSVKILTGQGNGTFTVGETYGTASSSTIIGLEDINADGKLDLLTTSSYGYISTLTGNGDGTFQDATTYSVWDAGTSVVGDFNEDGRADLAYTDYWYGRIGVMLGGCPDLEIKKTHVGDFIGGQNHYYSIIVKNVGGGSIGGPISFQDILPAGLTATQMYGYPMNCTLETLTCTYNGTLPAGSGLAISLYVNVSSTAPTSVTNVVNLTAPNDTNPSNNSASDPTTIVHAADLLIKKTHTGNVWVPGQTANYTITVGNVGTGPTVGTVTVQDSLPPQLTAIAMSGTGWNCNVGTRTCTRSDALAATAVYPPITLTVGVASGGDVANIAYVSGGGDLYSYNNTAYDPTRIFTGPTNVVATATSSTQVTVTWYPGYGSSNATTFEIFRAAPGAAYAHVGSTLSGSFIDSTAAPNTPYLYKIRMVENGVLGPFSNADYTTTRTYTDDPVVPRTTRIKRVHIEELRQAVNAVRQLAGMTTISWTDSSLVGVRIKKVHVTELRNALNEMRTFLGMTSFNYNDATTIKAQHITQLRTSLR